MQTEATYLERNPALRDALDEAECLVANCRGTNLDPIIEALDARLLSHHGEVEPAVTVHLRRDLVASMSVGSSGGQSGRQMAAAILCSGDDRVRVPLLAAVDGGLPALVPTIAATVFGGLRPPALAMASALAALVVVRGLPDYCRDMGRPLAFERLGPAPSDRLGGDRSQPTEAGNRATVDLDGVGT